MGDLNAARALANRIRLGEDPLAGEPDVSDLLGRDSHRDSMLRHGLLISANVTPLIESRLVEVCDRLRVPRGAVTAFVHNSSEVQADCVIDTPDTCVLRFSSGLINLMDEREFQFVAAHEIGHFLLGHGACSQYVNDGSAEGFLQQRAWELSADRIGYLGCNSLDESAQAIIKTASGLGDEFLRFDIQSFLSQTDMLSNPSLGESRNSTHPSMLIRCRALLWFSMSFGSTRDVERSTASSIQDVDRRVTGDLEKFVDGQMRRRRVELEDNIVLWKSSLLIVDQGGFTREMQTRLAHELGDESLKGLKSFLNAYDPNELMIESSSRLKAAVSAVFKEFPSSAKEIEYRAVSRSYEILGSEVDG